MEVQTKREIAVDVLNKLLRNRTRIPIADASKAGKARGVSHRTMQRAARDLKLREVHNGNAPGFWERPT